VNVTIREVAKQAGVSMGTVSRAFNGYADISPETKERIVEAARILGYTPNVNARSLSAKVAPNMGIIVSGLMESDGKDGVFLSLLQGIYRYTLQNDFEITLYATDSQSQNQKPYVKFCKEHNISGTILSGITTNDPYFHELVNGGMPCVLIDVHLEGKGLGCVSIDNYAAAKELTQYLFDRNHREIMLISGKKNAAVNIERIASVYQAFHENNLSLEKDRVMYCDFNEEMAYNTVIKHLKKYGKSQITAFLCLSDIMALGVMRAVKDCGFSVPEDFSVVGFDGIPMCSYLTPKLTTITQDINEMGYQSAKLLHELVMNDNISKNVYVSYKLTEGESVKAL
jgi:LacI family transcriptional regulator